MDVTILFKWGYDPEDAYVSSDGTFKWKRGKLTASDDDAAAMVSAKKLAADTGGKLAGATIGDGDTTWAAARGAESTFSAAGLKPVSNDLEQARQLSNVIEKAGNADVVVMADAIEHAGVAPALAAMLDLGYVGSLRDFEVDPDDPSSLIGHRSVDEGTATLRFKAPVLISVQAKDSEKNVPSMKQVLAAKRSPVEKVDAPDGGEGPLAVVKTSKAEAHMAQLFDGDPDTAAQALVAALKNDGVL